MPPSLAALHPYFNIQRWHKYGLSRFSEYASCVYVSEHWCVHYTANALALGTEHSRHMCSYIKTMSESSLLTSRESSSSKMYIAPKQSLASSYTYLVCPCDSLSPTRKVVVHSRLCCMLTHMQLFDSNAWQIMHGKFSHARQDCQPLL